MEINYANQIGIKQLAAVALLVICLTQLPARGGQSGVQTELLSYAMGIVPGQKMRITAVNQQRQDGTAAGSEPLIWRVSATDADGNQVFQSNEIVS